MTVQEYKDLGDIAFATLLIGYFAVVVFGIGKVIYKKFNPPKPLGRVISIKNAKQKRAEKQRRKKVVKDKE